MHRVVVALFAAGVLTGLVAGNVGVVVDDSHIEQNIGRTTTDSLVVDGYTMTYGGGATGMTVYVNKSSSELTADVRITLTTLDGTTVYSQTKSGVLLDSDPTAVPFTFDRAYGTDKFARVRIVVARSL